MNIDWQLITETIYESSLDLFFNNDGWEIVQLEPGSEGAFVL
jgi:hypothetical protein